MSKHKCFKSCFTNGKSLLRSDVCRKLVSGDGIGVNKGTFSESCAEAVNPIKSMQVSGNGSNYSFLGEA